MAKEIERKFLLKNDAWKIAVINKKSICQGYIAHSDNSIVRIRIADNNAWLTIKSITVGISRDEFEYQIPKNEAEEMLKSFANDNLISKTRYYLKVNGREWIIDAFNGDNSKLILAEVELESENELIPLPDWAGKEVTDDFRYTNLALAKNPFNKW